MFVRPLCPHFTGNVEQWYPSDYGASKYFFLRRPADDLPPYGDPATMLTKVVCHSAKLQALLGLVSEICNVHGGRVLIFTDWPMTQWLVEMVLSLAGLR